MYRLKKHFSHFPPQTHIFRSQLKKVFPFFLILPHFFLSKIRKSGLGEILGLSDRTIGHYEANERFPKSAQLLMSIARYFEVPIEHLLSYEAPPTLSIEEFYDQAN